jgi:acetyltransferase-like isoleucine patch superfamily enzyme
MQIGEIVRKPFSLFTKIFAPFKIFIKWYLPNMVPLLNKQIQLHGDVPKCNQKTIISGLGKVTIGTNCVFGYKLGGGYYNRVIELQPRYKNAVIKIGQCVSTNNNLFICAANSIKIGACTLIGQNVTIMDHEAHGIEPENRRKVGVIGNVELGENVWVGNNVTILKNTVVGDNSIIATGAVVSGKFPSNVIIGGVPAKVIKKLNESTT